MAKELVISTSPHETKVALLEDGQVVEVSVERERETGLVGSIYKGRVTRVLPGMQSAFINIGLERDAFLYVSDFFEDRSEYERILASAEEGGVPATEESPAVTAMEAATEAEAAAPEAGPAAESPATPEQAEPAAPPPSPAPPPLAQGEPRMRRPLGRRSQRARHRGHRGGRGRGRDRFPPRGYAPAPPREPEAYEPIVLPGESLAKYKDRVPSLQSEAPTPAGQPSESRQAPPQLPSDNTRRLDVAPEPEAPVPKTPAESLTSSVEAEELTLAPSPERTPPRDAGPARKQTDHREAARRKRESDYIQVAEVDTGESFVPRTTPAPSAPPAPGAPAVASATPLEEVEAPADFGHREVRGEEENGSVALPPSVRERTAGGVEWERPLRRGGRRRGRHRRERRGPRPRPALGPRPKITELLQPGQELIVQIAKEQIGTKGARITSHVTLPGRYVVYMPTIEHVGVSRRIRSDQQRARLRRLLLELKGSLSGGIVVRTVAENASDEDIRRDLDYLVKLWRDIVQRTEHTPAPLLLHRDLGLMERMLRDHLTPEFESIWIDNEEEYTKAVEFVSQFQPGLAPRLKLYTRDVPVFEAMGIQAEIEQALRPKVWLKSGGYIVINHTEALVAIDVNTGKFVGKGSSRLEDTIVRTNLDAVKEIVRQIRLRDLGGIIIIDFIDMEDPRNRRKVMNELERALREDRSPSKTLAFNEFGLIAITRKRVRQSLEKVLCQPCPYCTGTGMVKSVATLCYEIQAEANKMARTIDAPELTIRTHPEIAKALKAREPGILRELEEQTGKNILVQADQSLHFDQYTIF